MVQSEKQHHLRPAQFPLSFQLQLGRPPEHEVAVPEPAVRSGPEPSWVDRLPLVVDDGDAAQVLLDVQFGGDRRNRQKYERHVYRVRNAADIKFLAGLKIEVPSDHMWPELHVLCVHRGGQTISELTPSNVRFLPAKVRCDPQALGPPKTVLEHQAVVLLALRALRPGDLVEVAYTMYGSGDPGFDIGNSLVLSLARDRSVGHLRQRVLHPKADGPLQARSVLVDVAPRCRDLGEYVEYVWEARDVPAALPENKRAFRNIPHAETSTFADWHALARRIRPLFHRDEQVPAEVAAIAARIAGATTDPVARALAALRYIQHEIAYNCMDTRSGPNTPKSLARVVAERNGDCKGKTLLLLAILRELAIEADAVFVHQEGARLPEWLPSPCGLNHVLVFAEVSGRRVFMDPTIQGQRGDLETATKLPFFWGLSLRPGEGLVRIPHPCDDPAPHAETEAHYLLCAPGEPAYLRFRRRNRGPRADEARGFYSSQNVADVVGRMRALLEELHGCLEDVERFRMWDVEEKNEYHLAGDFLFGDLWRGTAAETCSVVLSPVYLQRELELAAEQPELLRTQELCCYHEHTLRIESPCLSRVHVEPIALELPGCALHRTVDVDDGAVVVRDLLRLCSHTVKDAAATAAALGRIIPSLAVRIYG